MKLNELIEAIAAGVSKKELDTRFPLYVCDADTLAPIMGVRCEKVLTAYYDEWEPASCIRKVAKKVISGEITVDRFYDWLVKGV